MGAILEAARAERAHRVQFMGHLSDIRNGVEEELQSLLSTLDGDSDGRCRVMSHVSTPKRRRIAFDDNLMLDVMHRIVAPSDVTTAPPLENQL